MLIAFININLRLKVKNTLKEHNYMICYVKRFILIGVFLLNNMRNYSLCDKNVQTFVSYKISLHMNRKIAW